VPGLALQASLLYHGSQYTSASNQYELPSWARIDVGARYETRIQGHDAVFRLGVENVADRDYWATSSPQFGQITQGRGRTVKASMSLAF